MLVLSTWFINYLLTVCNLHAHIIRRWEYVTHLLPIQSGKCGGPIAVQLCLRVLSTNYFEHLIYLITYIYSN